MADAKYAHEKRAARDRARGTPYDLPIPEYCPWPADGGIRCGGNLHVVDKLHGEQVVDSRGVATRATICEKCHHVTVYETKGTPMAKDSDVRKRAREFASELEKTGVLIDANGLPRKLQITPEGKHWKVRTENGSYIYAFSTTPSDFRSLKNCEAQLRKLNVRWGPEAQKILDEKTNGNGKKHPAPAPSADNLTPLQERAIAVRARLATLRQTLGATHSDLVKIGMEAADKRKLWKYKTNNAAEVQISRFLSGQNYGTHNAIDFYEAMCDEIEDIPPEKFGTATKPITKIVAPEPEPAPEPAPVPAAPPKPTPAAEASSQKIAALTVALDEANSEIKLLKTNLAEKNAMIDAITKRGRAVQEEKGDLIAKLDAQRAETLSAQAMVRQLRAQLDERPAPTAVVTDDPLYIKALRRLVSASSTEDEIREAFEMAMEIARGQL